MLSRTKWCVRWQRFHESFHDSEVILWARIQFIAGAAYAVLSTSDLSPVISNPKYLWGWMMFNSFVTEYLRRRREHPGW